MLFNPKWEAPVKSDPMSLDSLIAWLEKQPASGAYSYIDAANCMLCKYFRSHGLDIFDLDCSGYSVHGSSDNHEYPYVFAEIANGHSDRSWTFGAALKRARACRDNPPRL